MSCQAGIAVGIIRDFPAFTRRKDSTDDIVSISFSITISQSMYVFNYVLNTYNNNEWYNG